MGLRRTKAEGEGMSGFDKTTTEELVAVDINRKLFKRGMRELELASKISNERMMEVGSTFLALAATYFLTIDYDPDTVRAEFNRNLEGYLARAGRHPKVKQ